MLMRRPVAWHVVDDCFLLVIVSLYSSVAGEIFCSWHPPLFGLAYSGSGLDSIQNT